LAGSMCGSEPWSLATGRLSLAACRWFLVVGCGSGDGTWPEAQGKRQKYGSSPFNLAPYALRLLPYNFYLTSYTGFPAASRQRPLTRGQYPASSIQHQTSSFRISSALRAASCSAAFLFFPVPWVAKSRTFNSTQKVLL
jgi:hypothetical protein